MNNCLPLQQILIQSIYKNILKSVFVLILWYIQYKINQEMLANIKH